MEDKKLYKNLFNLAIAGLLSGAEFDFCAGELLLKSEIDKKKIGYLADIVTDSNLGNYVKIEHNRGQFTIHSHALLTSLQEQWYKEKVKIFSQVLDPNLINLQSIIISVNLFGSRKLKTISIPTSIDKNYIKAISYCMEQHIKVPVVPGTQQIKITNIPRFILSAISEIPAINSAELINFLTETEKKKIMEGVLLWEKR